MIASYMCRSIYSRRKRNGSIRTARPGAPCSPLPGNRIGFSEQSSRIRTEISKAPLGWHLSDLEELNPMIGIRVASRGTGDQQGYGTIDLMFGEPGPGKIPPIQRIFKQQNRLHTTAKSQFLAHGRIMA